MFKRSLHLLLFFCVCVAVSWAAESPFAGNWKLNPAKSTLPDQFKVESAGGNKYTFNFGPGNETIAVDGTDQPTKVLPGGTLSVAIDGDTWKVVRKQNGRTLISAVWSLSKDGNQLTDHFTGFNADGSPYKLNYVYRRKAGGPGFAGTWVSISLEAVNYVVAIQIKGLEDGGLAIVDAASQFTGNREFAASAVRKVDENTVELMRKKDDKLSDFLQLKLSADGKTLTITPRSAPGAEPHVYVFERQ